ncbi:hypothetical protein Q765_19210 [Flavobacterium rivuli WB 3.3-2 = DSM 21788]|uniref:DUF3095 domain-containing protein n=2 Tax=Flavobacterium rivuli TaxID=498301 RepID=A0A0A2LZX4_9FLAO|nr:DUF3095 domain-containing protein [Flavobacterium rivuli]KGO84896.1 hypothetical protein Q765_19210 [Flavobacterium rivuli WB 3.3-2 = DSM 21788]
MTDANEQFYSALPLHKMPLHVLLVKQKLFSIVPADWHVVITDITGSTNAVLQGRHEDVNLIATGSIVSVLNLAFGMDIIIPFFFGGDGATFIVPPVLIHKVMHALTLYKNNTLANFNLSLRAGTVPVADIYEQGHEIHIAKYSSSATFSIPIVLGNGLNYAEKIIKGDDYMFAGLAAQETILDLSGMQCRWDKIPPPADKEEIVTLLIIAKEVSQQAVVFKKVLEAMEELYGAPEIRQPISVGRLKLKTTFSKLGNEMRARLGKIRFLELLKTWIVTFYGYIYFSTKKGRDFLKSLVDMSDTLVIDGRINTVITGNAKQRVALQNLLNVMEANGEIIYGIHISGASIMSCYVRNLDDGHIHFVDGAEGGYTQAARMLKAKL